MRCNRAVFGALALLSANFLEAAPQIDRAPTIQVAQGELKGVMKDGVNVFLGIPFAQPPIGEMRFRDPAKAAKWMGTREANAFGPNCPQPETPGGIGPWSPEYLITGPIGEDCLYLNVWAPALPKARTAPVLFWIHGGGFNSGSGSVPIYRGANLAAKGIVVVTINYRLGPLGFLADPRLARSGETVGNYGIKDAIAALKWVHDNIGAFGGDPTRITIAGQSAGSAAVHALLGSPTAKGLFAAAIPQSGSGVYEMSSLADAEKNSQTYTNALVPRSEDLRSAPVTQLVTQLVARRNGSLPMPSLMFGPVIDQKTISSNPALGSDVPVLTGFVADELSAGIPHDMKMTAADFSKAAEKLYGLDGPELLKLYPESGGNAADKAFRQATLDRALASLWLWARDRAPSHRAPVFGYLFRHVEPGPESSRYGAFHSSEIPYVFANLEGAGRAFTVDDRRISETIGKYWINFVSTGDPNGTALVKWPTLDVKGPVIVSINNDVIATPLLDEGRRNFYLSEAEKGIRPPMF